MESDIAIVPAETGFEEFLRRPEHRGRMPHVDVVGVLTNEHVADSVADNIEIGPG